jgi:hypothetical protein
VFAFTLILHLFCAARRDNQHLQHVQGERMAWMKTIEQAIENGHESKRVLPETEVFMDLRVAEARRLHKQSAILEKEAHETELKYAQVWDELEFYNSSLSSFHTGSTTPLSRHS